MSHTPLNEPTFFILTALAPAPNHGYGIMQEVENLSNGRLHLSTGTLYAALKRLLDSGWIEDVTLKNAPRGRKDYRLTPTGRTVLNEEMERMKTLIVIGERQLRKGEA